MTSYLQIALDKKLKIKKQKMTSQKNKLKKWFCAFKISNKKWLIKELTIPVKINLAKSKSLKILLKICKKL